MLVIPAVGFSVPSCLPCVATGRPGLHDTLRRDTGTINRRELILALRKVGSCLHSCTLFAAACKKGDFAGDFATCIAAPSLRLADSRTNFGCAQHPDICDLLRLPGKIRCAFDHGCFFDFVLRLWPRLGSRTLTCLTRFLLVLVWSLALFHEVFLCNFLSAAAAVQARGRQPRQSRGLLPDNRRRRRQQPVPRGAAAGKTKQRSRSRPPLLPPSPCSHFHNACPFCLQLYSQHFAQNLAKDAPATAGRRNSRAKSPTRPVKKTLRALENTTHDDKLNAISVDSKPMRLTGVAVDADATQNQKEEQDAEVDVDKKSKFSGAVADGSEMEQLAEFVRTVPLLSGMTDAEMSWLVPALVRVEFGGGVVIMRQGDDGDAMYLLESGSARAEITRVGVVKEYVAGGYFGELALLTSKQRAATVRAGEGGAVCLKLGRAAFQVVVRRSGAALWREVETYAARLVQARWRGKLEWRKVVAATMLMTSSEEEDIVEDVVEEDVAEDFAEEQDDDDDDEAAVAGATEAEETEEEEMEEETDGKLELAAEVESPTANGTHLPWSSPPAPAFGPAVVPLVRPPSKQSSPTPSGASCSLCGKRRPAAGGVGMHSCKCDAPALMVHRQPSNALAQQHSPPRIYNDDHEVDEGEAAKATKTEDQTAEAVSAADEETEEEADSDSEDPKPAAEGEAEERVGFARTVPRRRPLPKGARPASATPALLEGHQFDEETEEETEEEDSESEEEEASAGNQRRQGATNGPTQPVKPAIAQHRGRARPPPPKPADAPPPPPPVLLPLSPASALPQPNSPASNTAAKQLGQLDELQRLMQAAESAVGASPAPAALPSPGVASVRVAMVEEHEGGLGGLAEGHDEEHGEEEAMQESETEQGDVTEDSEGTEDSASDGGSEPASQSGPPVKIGRTQSQQTRLDRAKKSQAAEQARAKQARLRQAQAQLFRPNSATAEASNRTPTRRAKPQPTVVGGRPSPRLAWAGGAAAKAAAATAERRMRQQRVADARAAAADALSSTTAARWKDRSAGVERVRVAQGQAEAAAVFSATAEQKAASQRGLLARRARERKVPTERGRASAAARAAAAERGGGGGDQVEFHDSLRPAGRLATAAAGQAVSPTAVSGFTLHAETRMAAAVAAPAVGTGAGGRSGADQRKIARRDAMAGRARQRGKSKRPGVVVAGVASKVRM